MNQPVLREAAVTKYAFEEVYFSKDSIDGNSKYTFQFPSDWNGLPTKKKAIGFRYAKCSPSSYYIVFDVIIQGNVKDGDTYIDETLVPILPVHILVTESNSLFEVVYEIEKQLNDEYEKWYKTASVDQKVYFNDTLYLTTFVERNFDGSYNVFFDVHASLPAVLYEYELSINYHVVDNDHYHNFDYDEAFRNLYRFLNQDIPEHNYNIDFCEFDNCWDRKNLYIHSDIVTNTNYQLLDPINTFYRKPSKIYEHNDSGNVFHIWVSFDGKHKQELKHDEVEIALCFVADVRENYM